MSPSDFEGYLVYLRNQWNRDKAPRLPGKKVFDQLVKTTVDPLRIEAIWVGDPSEADLACDLMLEERDGEEQNVERIRTLLVDKGIVFQPW